MNLTMSNNEQLPHHIGDTTKIVHDKNHVHSLISLIIILQLHTLTTNL